MKNFRERMREDQIKWRRENISIQEKGKQNGRYYDHVLPSNLWQQNLWPGINDESDNSLPSYLLKEKIKKHTGVHNLLSSWIVCANMFYPFREKYGRQLLLGFLRQIISDQITSVNRVELEHAFSESHLSPNALLGETDGYRGAGQTSPDVAFEISTKKGSGVVLVECKFTEHSFYPCSGRKKKSQGRPPNPVPSRCSDFIGVIKDPTDQCHLNSWGRSYWDHLTTNIDLEVASTLKSCPAAFGGYQLFRQQALAEGLAKTSEYPYVVSAVVYDERNTGLMKCLARSTGIDDIRNDWRSLFSGQSHFITFTHQEWVNWIDSQDQGGFYSDWLNYVKKRYRF